MDTSFKSILARLAADYPDREARALARHVLEVRFGVTQTDICLGRERNFSIEERQELENIVNRLLRREPLQYVLGQADFCGRTFAVAPGVLVPRPETEELVGWIVGEEGRTERPASALDIGTGSGCIAVTLVLELPHSRVEAWELSPDALAIARRNASKWQARVDFVQRDILHYDLSQVPPRSLDLIVSNPPYVRQSERESMSGNVLDYEPNEALFVPDATPLLFYDKIASDALTLLSPGGRLYFEINETQGEAIARMLAGYGYEQIRIIKDLYDKDRFASASKPHAHG